MKTSGLLLALGLIGAQLASAQVPSTLANFSSRGQVGQASGSLLAGFVVEGSTAKSVLLRGVGPGLGAFGVPNPAANVNIRVYDATGTLVAANDGYQTDPNAATVSSTAAALGAFPLSNAGDSATVATLAPGAYSIEIAPSAASAPDGDALLEVYDADAPGTDSRLVNLSTRGQLGADGATLITGFVVTGADAKTLLVRGVGPDLSNFGVGNAAGSVSFTIYDANGNVVAAGGGMSDGNAGAMAATAVEVGAFPLNGTGDSAAVVSLAPGAYTIAVTPSSSAGVGLVEVYDADSTSAAQQH